MRLKKFQMGGPMPAEGMPAEGMPMEAGAEAGAMAGAEAGAMAGEAAGGDPVMQLVEMAMQALEAQDPQLAMAVCDGLIQLAQGGPSAPGGEPGAAPEEPVMMRKGGKMKAKKAGKRC